MMGILLTLFGIMMPNYTWIEGGDNEDTTDDVFNLLGSASGRTSKGKSILKLKLLNN